MMVSKVTRILKSEMPRIYRFNNLINVLRIEDKHHTYVLPNNGRRPVLGLHDLQRNGYCCLVRFVSYQTSFEGKYRHYVSNE